MIRGLLEKSLRESWVAILIGWVALGLVAGLLTLILPRFQEGLSELILQMPFFRMMISGLMGIDASEGWRRAMCFT